MGRRYSICFENVLVAAAQDLVQVIGATGKIVMVHRVWWGATDTTIPTSQQASTRCSYLPATVTNGSGGTSGTARPFDPGDAAASVTAKLNSTTQAASTGKVTLHESGDNLYNGFEHAFAAPPIVGPSASFVLELLSTVSGTVHMSGGVEVEEIGG